MASNITSAGNRLGMACEKLIASPGEMTPARRGATLAHLEQAVKWQPSNYRVHLLLGQLYAQTRQWGSALEHYEAAAKADRETDVTSGDS